MAEPLIVLKGLGRKWRKITGKDPIRPRGGEGEQPKGKFGGSKGTSGKHLVWHRASRRGRRLGGPGGEKLGTVNGHWQFRG